MSDREALECTQRVLAEVVRRVEAIMETPEAGRLITRSVNDRDPDVEALLDQVSDVLKDIEAPGGGSGALRVDEDTGKPYIVTDLRVTGHRVVSDRFDGVVWNEEMDRP